MIRYKTKYGFFPTIELAAGRLGVSVEKAEGYLAHKWGLEGNLVSSHPYKSTPPTKQD